MLAKLVSYAGARPSIAQVAGELALSPSQVHASLMRLARLEMAYTCVPAVRPATATALPQSCSGSSIRG